MTDTYRKPEPRPDPTRLPITRSEALRRYEIERWPDLETWESDADINAGDLDTAARVCGFEFAPESEPPGDPAAIGTECPGCGEWHRDGHRDSCACNHCLPGHEGVVTAGGSRSGQRLGKINRSGVLVMAVGGRILWNVEKLYEDERLFLDDLIASHNARLDAEKKLAETDKEVLRLQIAIRRLHDLARMAAPAAERAHLAGKRVREAAAAAAEMERFYSGGGQ